MTKMFFVRLGKGSDGDKTPFMNFSTKSQGQIHSAENEGGDSVEEG
jgi:hypothetical protein